MRTTSAALLAKMVLPHYIPVLNARFWLFGDADGYMDYASAKVFLKPYIISAFEYESENDYHVQITLSNADNFFTSKSFIGYNFQLGFGAFTTTEEFDSMPPMVVSAQQNISQPGRLVTVITAISAINRMQQDHATEPYQGANGDGITIKTLLTAILTHTMTAFFNAPAYVVHFDSEDSLIDTVCPGKDFVVYEGDARWDKVKELLGYTSCVLRIDKFGEIHIFNPVTSGTTYEYTYTLAGSSAHKFFYTANHRRLVSPNYVSVISAHDEPRFDGLAYHADSSIRQIFRQYLISDIASDAQAASVAQAILGKSVMGSETGVAEVPMSFIQELWDYVAVVDSRTGATKAGNIQYIMRSYEADTGKYRMLFSFGPAESVIGSQLAAYDILAQEDPNFLAPIVRDLYDMVQDLADQVKTLSDQTLTGGAYAKVPKADMSDGHIDLSAAVTDTAKLPVKLNMSFTATDYRSFSWSGGTIYMADSSTQAVNSGSSGNLSGTNYLYCDLDDTPSTLKLTTTFSTAATGRKILIAVIVVNSDTTRNCAIVPAQGAGATGLAFIVAASNIVATDLSAITADLGLVTAGEFRLGNGNTPGGSPSFTGIRIYKSGSTYRIEGIYENTVQAYFGSDGKFGAGGGDVIADSDSLKVKGSGKLKFYYGDTLQAQINSTSGETYFGSASGIDLAIGAGGDLVIGGIDTTVNGDDININADTKTKIKRMYSAQDTISHAMDTTYSNGTTKLQLVIATALLNPGDIVTVLLDGTSLCQAYNSGSNTGTIYVPISFLVPVGSNFEFDTGGGSPSINACHIQSVG